MFDAGQSDIFARNACVLGIDLASVDFAVLSHGHYDHGGGIATFLQLNKKAQVYVSDHAFEPHYNCSGKYIGLDTGLMASDRIATVGRCVSPADGVTVISWGDAHPRWPVNSFGLNMLEEERLVPDDFRHEQYMMVEEGGKRILFSGCSHKGVLSIVDRFQPDVLIGGFHYMKLDTTKDAEQLSRQAALLCEYKTEYYTCHCTGTEQYEYLRPLMGKRLHYLSTGMTVEI